MIAILDIGKTNKKCFVFNETYRVVWEKSATLPETTDEDGDPCEDLAALKAWIQDTLREVLSDRRFDIRAINFTSYGASFVLLDAAGREIAPLYNYLKPFPDDLKYRFYNDYGGAEKIALETASPVLGSLNSGPQLYRLKHRQPDLFRRLHTALHLPQYVSFLATSHLHSDITSIGCHTQLWDFQQNRYHHWVRSEGIDVKLAPVFPSDGVLPAAMAGRALLSGVGLHDSSAALIPYLASFREPFVLISTGTWCISLSPFNYSPLTTGELQQDCLCYLSYTGKPVKAARLFAGQQHDQGAKELAGQFGKPAGYFKTVRYDAVLLQKLSDKEQTQEPETHPFEDYETAYHALMSQIVRRQYLSTKLVLTAATKKVFVDGGFSHNPVYMQLLANRFPELEVYAAAVAQATAAGAAMAIHRHWNGKPLRSDLIDLKRYFPHSYSTKQL